MNDLDVETKTMLEWSGEERLSRTAFFVPARQWTEVSDWTTRQGQDLC
jgi:hypothetical protein